VSTAPPSRAAILREALVQAGEVALAHWSAALAVQTKPDGTPVTEADLAAERVIVAALRAAFPDDAIVTEESGGRRGEGAWWAVDPIDGTSSYVEGLAHWGPTVARMVPDGGRLGVDCGGLYLPRLGELYHLEARGPGAGAWFNGRPMLPFAERTACRTVYLPSKFHRHFRLRYSGKSRCIGGSAAHLALVARGAAEAAIIAPGWSLWDTAVGLGLITFLGGRVASLHTGAPLDPFANEGEAFVAGAPEAVAAMVRPGAISPLSEDA